MRYLNSDMFTVFCHQFFNECTICFWCLQSGAKYGDEYLANIDFIEAAETHKEGYEAEVVDPELEQTKRSVGRSKANGEAIQSNFP